MIPSLARRLAAEALGTAFLLAAVIGSGIMAQKLSGGNAALALLCNTLPTGAILVVLILTLRPRVRRAFQSGRKLGVRTAPGLALVSGGSIRCCTDRWGRGRRPRGACDVRTPNLAGGHDRASRSGPMAGRICRQLRTDFDNIRMRETPAEFVAYAVGLYITAAYWFTASTSFANPAVTLARSLSDTFAGIAPSGIIAFVLVQLAGAIVAGALARWIWPDALN